MSRRPFALAGLALAVLSLAPAALAARVHVRVEGKTQTIFGGSEPVLQVSAGNALGALEVASARGEFYYHVRQTAFGPFVDQIGRYTPAGLGGWSFKVNGASPPVGADKVTLEDGDRVLWYWSVFDVARNEGSPTLELSRVPAQRNCYRVFIRDDKGTRLAARAATVVVGSRRVRARGGRACVGRHSGLVRATQPGAVRSNALP